MFSDFAISFKKQYLPSVVFDVFALLFAYFIPALSHLSGIPLYFAEPMRLVIILSIIFTRPANAYLLAISLPLFSYSVAAHPVFLKSLIMSVELLLNVFLLYLFSKYIKSLFSAALLSILMSKLFYYLLKYSLITFALLEGNLFSTPVGFQLVTLLVFSLLVFLFFKSGKNEK
ncbi:MAG: hypothetical protein GX437_01260 [Sphingobacteriales bacterium]|nr:hypothetical protein [Sphingobacteriales bacterium]